MSAFGGSAASKFSCLRPYSPVKYLNNICKLSSNVQIRNEAVKTKNSEVRFNSMQIQMLPEKLFDQVFKGPTRKTSADASNAEKIKSCIENLKKFDLWNKNTEPLPEVEFDLPKLEGNNIDEHFKAIAVEQSGEYFEALLELSDTSLPIKPETWVCTPGWTKYAGGNAGQKSCHTQIDFPDEKGLIFDCEVLVPEGEFPVMAVAASKDNWYSWCSKRISDEHPEGIKALIPMEAPEDFFGIPKNKRARMIVGHNVSYDRARIKEQFYLEETKLRFMDTMSMHMAVSGFTGAQRMLYKSGENDGGKRSSWLDAGTLNGLSDVHQHYCGSPVDKSTRDVFVDGTIEDVRLQFQDLMSYCCGDVEATHNVLKKLFPLFCQRFPHPVTFAAMLEMGQMYLPINGCWTQYIRNADIVYEDLNRELQSTLVDIANNACHMLHGDKYKSDPWLWDLDWSTKPYKLLMKPRKNWSASEQKCVKLDATYDKLSSEEEDFLGISYSESTYCPSPLMQTVLNTASLLPKVQPHLPGYPKWYRELCMKETDPSWVPGPAKLSTLTKVTPKLLRMTWAGFPLHHDRSVGWGYLVPKDQALNIMGNNGASVYSPTLDDEIDSDMPVAKSDQKPTPIPLADIPEGYLFYKMPHKNGAEHNVGSPLSHDFLQKLDDGILNSADARGASRCLEINLACSYWRSSQERIHSQIFMNLPEESLPLTVKNHAGYVEGQYGAIIPLTIVCGTVTRRAVEPTWLTASNVREKSIGSELKAMIQAPPGYTFVGADVDSQELWIASLLGDASSAKEHGCTPLSWTTLQGSKSNKTDLHSKTADAIAITRDQAKAFNYARMYGAGQKLAKNLLQNFNYNVSKEEADRKITKLYSLTKGDRKYLLSLDGRYYAKKLKININPEAIRGGCVSLHEVKMLETAANNAFGHLKKINSTELIAGRVWVGGMESDMFNKLEKIARNFEPRTPFLGSRISRALEPSKVQENFLPSRINWVVQSSAVDYMHLMLVCMRWLIRTFSINARFSISIHDELKYLSTEEDRYRTALAMQISNLLTRCMFAHKLGMDDLPFGVAFFSSVEIDKAMRKQPNDEYITPSNPMGLQNSCGIDPGESVDILEVLQKTNGGQLTNDESDLNMQRNMRAQNY